MSPLRQKEALFLSASWRRFRFSGPFLLLLYFFALPSLSVSQGQNGNGYKVLTLQDLDDLEGGIPQGASTLAFVFDITGSMYDDLVQVIEGAAKILDTILERREKPIYNYVLVPFHDPDIGPITETTDPEEFQTHLRELYVQGGGDCPEMSIGAIRKALEVALPNSFIYVFTDASAKDYYLLQEVLTLVQRKESQVVFIMTGDCGNTSHPGFQVYEQIASTSSGQVFHLKKDDVNQVLNFVRVSLQARKVNLMAVDNDHSGAGVVEVLVDPSLREFTVSLSGDNPIIHLEDPHGRIDDASIGRNELLNLKNVQIVNIKDPVPGIWKVHINSSSAHTTRSTGLSSFDFVHGFSSSPTPNFLETYHRPLKGAPTYLILNGTEFDAGGSFDRVQLRGLGGDLLREIPLHRLHGHEGLFNATAFIPPDDFFYIQIVGRDKDGFPFQRISSTAISAQLPAVPEVNVKPTLDAYHNQPALLSCYVQSLVPFRVAWYRGERGSRAMTEEHVYEQTNEATYIIDRISSDHEDWYWCNASNIAGSSAMPLFLDVKEPPPTIIKAENVTAVPSTVVELSCHVRSTVPYSVGWSQLVAENKKPRFSAARVENNPRAHNLQNGTLLLHDVSKEDEGWYRCIASNEGGSNYQRLYLRIQDPPQLMVVPEEITFINGDLIEVECRSAGYPEPQLFWRLGEQIIENAGRRRVSGNKLIIENAERGDEAVYECVGKNPAGSDRRLATIRYTERPKIESSSQALVVGRGERAVLQCKAEGIPRPKIRWFKDSMEIYPLSYIQISGDGTLIILGVQEIDSGDYVCVATNSAGTAQTTIPLEVGSIPEIIYPPEDISIEYAHNGTLSCGAVGLPDPTIYWFKEKYLPLDPKRFSLFPNGSLHIQHAEVDDEGKFVCVARNKFGDSERHAKVLVTGIVKPILAPAPSSLDIKQGHKAVFPCKVMAANPEPVSSWFHNGKLIDTENNLTVEDGSLTIPDVQEIHEGIYTCRAENVGGNATLSITLNVRVPPVISDQVVREVSSKQGDTVLLSCPAEGDPKPSISWQKSGIPIHPTNRRYRLGREELEIRDVSENDAGTYICVAANSVGETQTVLTLKVQVPPKITQEKAEYKSMEGHIVMLPCRVYSVPPAQVSWYHNGNLVSPLNQEFTFLTSGGLRFMAELSNAGQYDCDARNAVGRDVKSLTLVVLVPPAIQYISPSPTTTLKGNAVTLQCESNGRPAPSVSWLKNGVNITSKKDVVSNTDGSLSFRSARLQDAGDYICHVENEAGQMRKETSLLVHDPPKISAESSGNKVVAERSAVVLPCSTTGYPTPVTSWSHSGQPITGNEYGVRLLSNGSLHITDAQVSFSGRYECTAVNEAGKDRSEMNLTVHVLPKLDKSGLAMKPSIISGELLVLQCPADSIPPPVITWMKDGKILNTHSADNIHISNGGRRLDISNISPEEAGKYMCTAENYVGRNEMEFDVTVIVPPHFKEPPLKNIVLVEDEPLRLECVVDGNPYPGVVWLKDNQFVFQNLHPSTHHRSRPMIYIDQAKFEDTGMYTCIASNTAGSLKTDFNVTVNVPVLIEGLSEERLEVALGHRVGIICPASGQPTPTMTWLHNSRPVNPLTYELQENGRVLSISQVKITDAGIFNCTATNDAGQMSKIIKLDVLVPPLIKESQTVTREKIVEGEEVRFSCHSEGHPPSVISWTRNGQPLGVWSSSHIVTNSGESHLTIPSARTADSGRYTCTATNKAGLADKDFSLMVLVSPVMDDLQFIAAKDITVTQPLLLVCPVTGNPPPTVSWLKNRLPFNIHPVNNLQIISDEGQNLHISQTVPEDAGTYTCVARNEAGESRREFIVNILVPPSIAGDRREALQVPENESVTLKCIVYGSPFPEITWLKDGQQIILNKQQEFANKKQFLHMQKIEEQQDSGEYSCIVTNAAGTADKLFHLNVLVAPRLESPTNTVHKIRLNLPATFECPVWGRPVPQIVWKANGTRLGRQASNIHISHENKMLKILRSKLLDSGTYTCIATNVVGELEVLYQLQVLVPPWINQEFVTTKQKVKENENFTLDCPAEGNPIPLITWLKNGEILMPKSQPRFTFLKEGKQLHNSKASISDVGKYVCIATNEAGTTELDFKVDIQVPPKFDNTVEEIPEIITNRPVVIACPVAGIPPPVINWFKDGKPLIKVTDPNMVLSPDGRVLKIRRARLTDAGSYKCVAYNVAGKTEKEFNLTVLVPPKITNINNEEDNWEGRYEVKGILDSSVALQCLVEGHPEPSIIWLKNGQLLRVADEPYIQLLHSDQVLQISELKLSSNGKYTCVASNVAGTTEKDFDLDILIPPHVSSQDNALATKVLLNRPVTLDCPIEANPKPTITWFKDGKEISGTNFPLVRLLLGGKRLQLLQAQMGDAGLYSCVGENVVGKIKKDIDLDIQYPPNISPTTKRRSVLINETISLECAANGNPSPKVTWLKDGHMIDTDMKNDLAIEVQLQGQILHIAQATLLNTGKYTCIASNEVGTDEEDIDLEVQVPPKIEVSDSEKSPSVYVTRSVTLECTVNAKPPPKLTWFKDGIVVSPTHSPLIQIHGDGQRLQILRTRDTDTGKYMCVALNPAGEDQAVFILDVLVPPSIDSDSSYDLPIHVLEGQPVDIDCYISGNPFPNVTWLKNGEDLSTQSPANEFQFMFDKQLLHIPNTKVYHKGQYTCIATSTTGTADKTFELVVQVPPQIDNSGNADLSGVINRAVTLECFATGEPEPLISWLKNGYPVDPVNEPNMQLLDKGQQLVIRRSKLSDGAKYTCIAVNAVGQDERTLNLNIQAPPRIDRSNYISAPSVPTDRVVTLECPVVGVPHPSVNWYIDGKPLFPSGNPRLQLLSGGQKIRISQSRTTDIGKYTCVADNEAGSDQLSFDLTILTPPVMTDNSARKLSVYEGELVSISCPVDVVLPLTITWLKDGQVLDGVLFPNIEIMHNDYTLKIMKTRPSDAGVYTCIAINQAGETEVYTELEVLVPPSIMKTSGRRTMKVTEGHAIDIKCMAEGNPSPDIEWLKDGVPLPGQDDSRQLWINPEYDFLDVALSDEPATSKDSFQDPSDSANFVDSSSKQKHLKQKGQTWQYRGNPRSIISGDAGPQRGDISAPEDYEDLSASTGPSLSLSEAWRYKGGQPPIALDADGMDVSLAGLVPDNTENFFPDFRISENGQILHISNASLSHAGTYTCVATSESGTAEKDIQLDVLVPATIDSSVVNTTVQTTVNERLLLHCPADGLPSPRVIWYKDSKLISPSNSIQFSSDGQQLAVNKVKPTHGGKFICVAINEAGDSEMEITVNVFESPMIDTIKLVGKSQAVLAESFALLCEASGVPTPLITWLKNQKLFLEQNAHIKAKNQYLEVTDAKLQDSGIYTCIAENEAGVAELDFKLELLVPPGIDADSAVDNLEVVVGQSVSLKCPASGDPKPAVTWTKKDRTVVSSDKMQLLENDYVLWLAAIQLSDTGSYKCLATNGAGFTEHTFNLTVLAPPSFGDSPVEDVIIEINSSLTLNCSAFGVPSPEISWTKLNDQFFPTPDVETKGQSLIIDRLQVEHAGEYSCRATNSAGKATKAYKVHIQVPPHFNSGEELEEVKAIIRSLSVLKCPAAGIPSPVITWHKEGQPLIFETLHRSRLDSTGKELHILNIQVTDSAVYACVASNPAGNVSRQFLLTVLVPPALEELPDKTVLSDTTIRFPCKAVGNPFPSITWLKSGPVQHKVLPDGQLEISSVKLSDQGEYTCTASNEAGSASVSFNLTVQVPPSIEELPYEIRAVVGSTAVLSCKVDAFPKAKIVWQKGSKILMNSSAYEIQTSGALQITSVSLYNAGLYTCTAQNAAGTTDVQRKLTILTPPKILLHQHKYIVLEGDELVVKCEAQGWPIPAVHWTRNGEALDTGNPLLNSVLSLSPVKASAMGFYQCVAENDAGTATEDVELLVHILPTIEANELRTHMIVRGNSVILPCKAHGFPPPHISWMHDGQVLSSSSPRITVLPSGDLSIEQASADDSGSYLCVAFNDAGKQHREYTLMVQVPPVITHVPQDIEVTLGEKFSLSCKAEGIPPPIVIWRHNNATVLEDLPSSGWSVYVVDQASKESAGIYTCVAQNTAGERQADVTVYVRVPPIILDSPGKHSALEAEQVVLTCLVEGDPQPQILWMKNGHRLDADQRVHPMSNGSLMIYNTFTDDAGQYKCVASNDVGAAEAFGELVIKTQPRFSVEPQDAIVELSQTAIFDCQAEGEPDPVIRWYRGKMELISGGHISIMPNNSLRITAVQPSDEGSYSCLAKNQLGSLLAVTMLLVKVHGEFSPWLPWVACSTTCGPGVQTRHRTCNNPEPRNGGQSCPGPDSEARACELHPCPVDGSWSTWTDWSDCTHTCDKGTVVRTRNCSNPAPAYGGRICTGEALEVEECLLKSCATHGQWSEWSQWTECSTQCGEGTQKRFRSCNNPHPSNGGLPCEGVPILVKPCRQKDCEVNGEWSNWGGWSSCSHSCGVGSRQRSRVCDNPPPSNGGKHCTGSELQLDYCNNEPCPVHGSWSPWSIWGECSASCNGGSRRRFRTCNSPSPSNGGRACIGNFQNTESCNQQNCPENGNWAVWSDWTPCSVTCGLGVRERFRTCSNPPPRFGGQRCTGDSSQLEECVEDLCYDVPLHAVGNVIGFVNGHDVGLSALTANITQLGMHRTIMATIDNLPPESANWLRSLASILSPIYWTTAYEMGQAVNGYSLTKGFFRRETEVSFATGEVLKMTHIARGVDKNGALLVDVVLSGEVPELPEDAEITLDHYTEDYVQTGPGAIYGYSTRMFRVDGYMLPYAWNHSIFYEDAQGKMPYLVQRLHTHGVGVDYNEDLQELNFIMSTAVSKGVPSNKCPSGFSLDQSGPYCRDDDECNNFQACSHGCMNTPGTYICTCPDGHSLGSDGHTCVDLDECKLGLAKCQSDQSCENTIGSYQCLAKCGGGFTQTSNGLSCEDINECRKTPSVCEQLCYNSVGSYHCGCTSGYHLVGRSACVDIDECNLLDPPCSHICHNSPGGYACDCPHGYGLINNHCWDLDECIIGNNDCRSNEECVNTPGSYDCIVPCPSGYTKGRNGSCIDTDECQTVPNACFYNQICQNTAGSYQCSCPRGYQYSGPNHPCIDINECAQDPKPCSYICHNLRGDFECICGPGQKRLSDRKSCAGLQYLEEDNRNDRRQSFLFSGYETSALHDGRRGVQIFHPIPDYQQPCPHGFMLMDGVCEDLDECAIPGQCQHVCENIIGSYRCQCPEGYRVAENTKTCDDIDECTEEDIQCGVDQMCFNTRGSYQCVPTPCPPDYQKDPVTGYCKLACDESDIPCPANVQYREILAFKMVAFPSGIEAYQDLLRLVAFDQDGTHLPYTIFNIVENDSGIPFRIRLENGKGVLYTLQNLLAGQDYRIKVQAVSYDNARTVVQYTTKFMVLISVSEYPY